MPPKIPTRKNKPGAGRPSKREAELRQKLKALEQAKKPTPNPTPKPQPITDEFMSETDFFTHLEAPLVGETKAKKLVDVFDEDDQEEEEAVITSDDEGGDDVFGDDDESDKDEVPFKVKDNADAELEAPAKDIDPDQFKVDFDAAGTALLGLEMMFKGVFGMASHRLKPQWTQEQRATYLSSLPLTDAEKQEWQKVLDALVRKYAPDLQSINPEWAALALFAQYGISRGAVFADVLGEVITNKVITLLHEKGILL